MLFVLFLTFVLYFSQANAGANLITHAPEIANWVASLYPDKRLVIGSYVYLDSAMFVKGEEKEKKRRKLQYLSFIFLSFSMSEKNPFLCLSSFSQFFFLFFSSSG